MRIFRNEDFVLKVVCFLGGLFHTELLFFTEEFCKIFSGSLFYKFTPVLKCTRPFDWPRSRMRIWGFFLRILSSELFFLPSFGPGLLYSGKKVARKNYLGGKKVSKKRCRHLSPMLTKCVVNMPWHEIFFWIAAHFLSKYWTRER